MSQNKRQAPEALQRRPLAALLGLRWLWYFLRGLVSNSLDAAVLRARTTPLTSGAGLHAASLLVEAQRVDPKVTLDELTGARLISSEHGSGSPAEMACIIDAELNRAARKQKTLTDHLTGGTGIYGPQGGRRPAATRRNATLKHLAAARMVLTGGERGISKNAERFFDPRAQDRLHGKYKAGATGGRVYSCRALGTLKAWSYDLPECGPHRCCADGMPPKKDSGPKPEKWTGPIQGVDAYRLMLFAPSEYGARHDAIYEAAQRVILTRSGMASFIDSPVAKLFALLALAALA